MKTFGLVVPAGKGSTFEKNVGGLLVNQEGLAAIVLPMLEAWCSLRIHAAELGGVFIGQCLRGDASCVRGFFYFYAVLIRAGEEEGVAAAAALEAGVDVAECGGIEVTDMGSVIDIEDGSCD